MSDSNSLVDVDKPAAAYKILNDNEIIKAVNKEHKLNSEEDNDEEEILINNDTVHSKNIVDMLGLGKCIFLVQKTKRSRPL